MPKQLRESVLIDTSFLITLYDNSRANHESAKKYFRYFIEHSIDMYISTIVASEYSQKGSISDILESGNYISLTFTMGDAAMAGDFQSFLSGENRAANDSRAAVKDDVKLLAQCSNNCMTYIATDDTSTLAKYARKLNEANKLETEVITMNAYDVSFFNGGQTAMDIEAD
jgi:hypothetical protein